jgi:GntR family transcriptional repressor for pyruvate dehydrogenase complex
LDVNEMLEEIASDIAEIRRGASQRVADRLLELILSGNLKAGDRLPSEQKLATAFHVSRPIIREALRGLSIMGVVESRQGGGCNVTDLSPARLTNSLQFVLRFDGQTVESLMEARKLLETQMIQLAVDQISKAALDQLETFLPLGGQLADDPVGFRVMDHEFHSLIWEASGNPFLVRIAEGLYRTGLEYRRIASQTEGVLVRSAHEHVAICQALRNRNRAAAVAATQAHLDSIMASTLQALSLQSEADSNAV